MESVDRHCLFDLEIVELSADLSAEGKDGLNENKGRQDMVSLWNAVKYRN
jgi:hypothetical protein